MVLREQVRTVGGIGELPLRAAAKSSGSKTSKLMRLPSSIRRNVYVHLGLPVRELVSLNAAQKDIDTRTVRPLILDLESDNPRETLEPGHVRLHETSSDDDTELYETPDTKTPGHRHRRPGPLQSLLLTSKELCTEIRRIFFSENTIGVSHSRQNSLQPLLDIGPSGWRELREIVVILQPCGCEGQGCTHRGFQKYAGGPLAADLFVFGMHDPLWKWYHIRPFDDGSHARDARSLRQWERICEGLALHGRPGGLRVSLGCRTVDPEVARRVVEPLSKLHRAEDVRVSFSMPPENSALLRQIAIDTVRMIPTVADGTPSDPFRFFDLPVELQLQILEHTSLRHVNTLRSRPGHLEDWLSPLPGCPRGKDPCHSAFCAWKTAGFGKRCLGHRPTLSWCRVSRRFSDLVKRVFFSQLDVQVMGWDGKAQDASFTNADTDPCAPRAFVDFLGRYRDAGTLGYIRRMTLVFPCITDTYLTPERKAWTLWLEAAEIMARVNHVSKMEVEIRFQGDRPGTDAGGAHGQDGFAVGGKRQGGLDREAWRRGREGSSWR